MDTILEDFRTQGYAVTVAPSREAWSESCKAGGSDICWYLRAETDARVAERCTNFALDESCEKKRKLDKRCIVHFSESPGGKHELRVFFPWKPESVDTNG